MPDQITSAPSGAVTGAAIIEWALIGLTRQQEEAETDKPYDEVYSDSLSIDLATGETIHDVGHLRIVDGTVHIGSFSDQHVSDHCVALEQIKGAHWTQFGYQNLGSTLLTWGVTVIDHYNGAARLEIVLSGGRTIKNVSHIKLDHGIADISTEGAGEDEVSDMIDARLVTAVHLQRP